MKIAISVPDALHQWVEREAKKLHVPRSHIFCQAVEELRDRRTYSTLVNRIDTALAGQLSNDSEVLPAAKRKMASILKDEPY